MCAACLCGLHACTETILPPIPLCVFGVRTDLAIGRRGERESECMHGQCDPPVVMAHVRVRVCL